MTSFKKIFRSKNVIGYLFISPFILGFLGFTLIPMVYSFILSFTEWNLIQPPQFVGLQNYETLINDRSFYDSLKATSIFVFASVPLSIILGVLMAVLLNQPVKGMNIFRTIFYMPSVITGVAVAMLWLWVFDSNYGLFNAVLRWVGIDGPNWLTSTTWALPSLIIMSLWSVGASMIIYLAALQGIPRQLYEAAVVDGANAFKSFWYVTVPMLTPAIFFNLILGVINSFQVFTQALVMTGGGPGNATLFYVLYLYQNAFEYFRMGYGATLGWILFVITLFFVLILFKTSGKWVHYESNLPTIKRKKKQSKKHKHVSTVAGGDQS